MTNKRGAELILLNLKKKGKSIGSLHLWLVTCAPIFISDKTPLFIASTYNYRLLICSSSHGGVLLWGWLRSAPFLWYNVKGKGNCVGNNAEKP